VSRRIRCALGIALIALSPGLGDCQAPGEESAASPAGFIPSPTARKFSAAPASWSIPLVLDGGTGFCRGGVPFPPGFLHPQDALRLDDDSPIATETLAHWPDGSVRWLLVEMLAHSSQPSLVPGTGRGAAELSPPTLDAGELVLRVDGEGIDLGSVSWTEERRTSLSVRSRAHGKTKGGLEWRTRLEKNEGEEGERLRLELRNPTPTTETNGQPTCMTLGCPGTIPIANVTVECNRGCRVRWEDECGAAQKEGAVSLLPKIMELRPGEQFGWEIVLGKAPLDQPLLEYSAAWACSTRALGPLVPLRFDLFGAYEQNSLAGVEGLRAGRNRPHWRNPREHGEDQRDWDGGVLETDFQTHNNEYEVHLTYAKQRLRSMGIREEASRKWHYLGLTGTRHFANVDIYHVHEGPLPFMHGAAFQHTRHGGSGQGDMHRSSFPPNMAHQTGRGLLAWYYLTGDPLLLESFLEVAENTRWRVMNGPGMPGISGTAGEERGPANALGVLTDAWAHTGDPRYLTAAKKVVDESHAKTKPYITAPESEWRCKPWMISLLVVALDEFCDQLTLAGQEGEGNGAKESAGLYKTFLNKWVGSAQGRAVLPYQASSDPDQCVTNEGDAWNVVGADALIDFYPDVAARLFDSGSRVIWYPGHPVGKYSKLLNHTVLSGWGHRTMARTVHADFLLQSP
jgi:hypothetical protein